MGAGNVIKPVKAPVVTDWVTVADITGTGKSIVESASINLPHPSNSFFDLKIEVKFNHERTAGTGFCRTWVKLMTPGHLLTTTDGDPGGTYYTSRTTTDSVRKRKVLISRSVIQSRDGAVDDMSSIVIRAVGTEEDTAFTVSSIRARLIYVPL